MNTLVLACLVGFPCQVAPVDREATVHFDAMHPMADAAGFVLTAGGLGDAVASPEGVEPPQMPGWPLAIAAAIPLEGAVYVAADGDAEPEILFSTGKQVHLVNVDGSSLPGWPITIGVGSRLAGGPSFGDLDGDGVGEVVVAADNWPNGDLAWMYAYRLDGTVVDGFPAMSFGDHARSPTVTDLDGDGDAEIITGERDWPLGRVYVFDGDGSVLPGWPVDIDHVPASSAGAADIDGDGVKEVLYESFTSLYAFNLDGSIVDGWPMTPTDGNTFSWSAPTFADVDGDGDYEIAAGAHATSGPNAVYLMDGDGTHLPGWPRFAQWWVYSPPTFADIDDDDELEIIAGDQVLSGSPANRVYAWNLDGASVPGWPTGFINAINAQVAVGDLDGDGDPELVWDDNTTGPNGEGQLVGYQHTGDPIEGWPLTTPRSTFFNTAAVTDADGDGDVELLMPTGAITAADAMIMLYDFPDPIDTADVQMPMFQYGPGRDGVAFADDEDCPADCNGDDALDVLDFICFQSLFVEGDTAADCNEDGTLDVLDFICFQGAFAEGCP